MDSIKALKIYLQGHGVKGVSLFIALVLIASGLLVASAAELIQSGLQSLIIWTALALITAFTFARHPIGFPGTHMGVSVSEALVFLATIMLSPYHGVWIAAVEVVVAGRSLGMSLGSCLFNLSNVTISLFAAGKIYYSLHDLLARESVGGWGNRS